MDSSNILFDPQQTLLNHARDNSRLKKIRNYLLQPGGGIYLGAIPDRAWAKQHLGETYDKIILASKGIEKLGSNNTDFTVLGGWCTLRTKDFKNLEKGFLIHPLSGKKNSIKSLSDVTSWIESFISFDQIIEAVGIYQGTTYVAISEVKLWTEKIISALKKNKKAKLSSHSKSLLQATIDKSEQKKHLLTKAYLKYITGSKITLTRVVDADHFKEISQIQSEVLKEINTTIDELIQPIIDRKINAGKPPSRTEINHIKEYINQYSKVWMFFTGKYLDLLKKHNYVKTSKAILLNSWINAFGEEIESRQLFFKKLFCKNNNYLQKNGINEDIAFAATADIEEPNFKISKLSKDISHVPNTLNFNNLLDRMSPTKEKVILDLNKNTLFNYGFNYLPYGKCRKALLEMVNISNTCYTKKQQLSKMTKKERKEHIQEIKKPLKNRLYQQEKIIHQELTRLFSQLATTLGH